MHTPTLMQSFSSIYHQCVPIQSTPVWSGVHTELERSRHSRMFKILPSGSVERHGIKAINLSWSCFNCLRLRIGESILTCAQCSRSCTTCAIFLLTFSVSTMLSEPQEPLLIEYLTSIFHIQTFTLPNSKNRSLYAQLKPGTQCPKTCYLIHYHLLNYMYGTT